MEEQDEQIVHIEQKAEEVAKDMEVGHVAITQAVVSAKGARKKRKICFAILCIIILIIAAVVAYVVVKIVVPKVNANKAANAQESGNDKAVSTSATAHSTATAADGNNADVQPSTAPTDSSVAASALDVAPSVTARAYLDVLD